MEKVSAVWLHTIIWNMIIFYNKFSNLAYSSSRFISWIQVLSWHHTILLTRLGF